MKFLQFEFNNMADQSYKKEEELRICNKCNKHLPLSCFSAHSGSNYLRPECRECNNEMSRLRSELKKIYGMPPIGYKCPVCGGCEKEVGGKGGERNGPWVLDHCHEEKDFRGWLCHKCNRGIGCFDDDIEKLNKAINYLNNFK